MMHVFQAFTFRVLSVEYILFLSVFSTSAQVSIIHDDGLAT